LPALSHGAPHNGNKAQQLACFGYAA